MAITLVEICDAISTTLTPAVTRAQSVDELREAITDKETLQIYPESNLGVDVTGAATADRSSFGGKGGVEAKPMRHKLYTIHADYYAQQRKVIGEDMEQLVTGIDALEAILEDQDVKPYFGLLDPVTGKGALKSFQWSWSRVTFVYGDQQLPYVGARFVILIGVF